MIQRPLPSLECSRFVFVIKPDNDYFSFHLDRTFFLLSLSSV